MTFGPNSVSIMFARSLRGNSLIEVYTKSMRIEDIQPQIVRLNADAWLLADYENHNQTVKALLGEKFLTRKIFLLIPKEGKPSIIAHVIDLAFLSGKDITSVFTLLPYKTWQEMLSTLEKALVPYSHILMDISENGLLPRVSFADYGTVDFVKKLGKEVTPSADILQRFSAVMTPWQLESQKDACLKALRIKDEAFAKIGKDVKEKGQSDEYEIQQFIAKRFREEGMVFDEDPIVAIGTNANNPHYGPTKDVSSPIKEGDLVLIDMWAKNKEKGSVYADITWMGYVGSRVPDLYKERFDIVKKARNSAINFLKEELPNRVVHGYEVDDVARKVITDAGYGDSFIHRLGHSITDDVSCHGAGANLDNFESHDFRELMDGTSFSDEPGIYAEDFGMRSETDLHIENRHVLVLGGLQEEIIPILKD